MAKRVIKQMDCQTLGELLQQVADKWTLLVMGHLGNGPSRFNETKKTVKGISQKSLSQCLRRLERNGLVKRTIIDGNVLGVEYELTALGLSLNDPFTALCNWINAHGEKMEVAQQNYDKRKA